MPKNRTIEVECVGDNLPLAVLLFPPHGGVLAISCDRITINRFGEFFKGTARADRYITGAIPSGSITNNSSYSLVFGHTRNTHTIV